MVQPLMLSAIGATLLSRAFQEWRGGSWTEGAEEVEISESLLEEQLDEPVG